jgi:hypothetical protein
MYWSWKIYTTKQFREIIYTKFRKILYKFREMYWYLKNLHNETISRNNLYEILYKFHEKYWYWKNLLNETISWNNLYEISRNKEQQNFAEFRGISRNFAKLKSLSLLFRISRNKKKSCFATTLSKIKVRKY